MAAEVRSKSGGVACCNGESGSLHETDAAPDAVLSAAATLFKALSDETRLRIIRTVVSSPHELCECNLVPLFGLSQSTISYHLKALREAGILDCERRGLWAYYRINPRALMAAVRTLTDLV